MIKNRFCWIEIPGKELLEKVKKLGVGVDLIFLVKYFRLKWKVYFFLVIPQVSF